MHHLAGLEIPTLHLVERGLDPMFSRLLIACVASDGHVGVVMLPAMVKEQALITLTADQETVVRKLEEDLR
jgi:hypothetical protein